MWFNYEFRHNPKIKSTLDYGVTYLLINSCLSGLKDSFSDKLSFLAIFKAILFSSDILPSSSRYGIGPSLESESVSSSLIMVYGRVFSLFSMVAGRPKTNFGFDVLEKLHIVLMTKVLWPHKMMCRIIITISCHRKSH